ncbi:MAG: zinc ribbon domain-containing protein [Kiritimatiellia bacterium]
MFMPLYEFYCQRCHIIFTFRSMKVRTGEVPVCPRCGCDLKKEVSFFSHIVKGVKDAGMNYDDDTCDRMDQVVAEMGDRMQVLENEGGDPREAVSVLRAMAKAGGVKFKSDVLEAMARIDAGEDPDKIDEMFGDVFETGNPFDETEEESCQQLRSWWRRLHEPLRDPDWHDWPTEQH